MKKLILHSFLFLILIGSFYLGILYLLSVVKVSGKPAVYVTNDYYVWKGGGTYEKFNDIDSIKNCDVIIVGSSRAYRHYNPKIFETRNIKAWNLGSSAQPIENSFYIIKNYIQPAKPKCILLDVARLGFDRKSIESSVDLITNTRNWELHKDILKENMDIRLFNTQFVSMFNVNTPVMYKDKEYLSAGFSTISDSLNENWLKQLNFLTEEKKNNMKIKDFNTLITILEFCQKHNQKIILVHSPISSFYSIDAQKNFVEQINFIANKYQVKFYDFQKIKGINTINHFYDDSHLNETGVEIFNNTLLNTMNF